MYSELVYFDGAHFAHIAAFMERLRLSHIRAKTTHRFAGSPADRRAVHYARVPARSNAHYAAHAG